MFRIGQRNLFSILLAMALLLPRWVGAQSLEEPARGPAESWADSLIRQMSDTALLGQLIMIRVQSDWSADRLDRVGAAIEKYRLGGLCFFQGGPARQLRLTNRYQALSDVPLFIAMDAEWGLGWRLDSAMRYPYQMALGAIRDNDLIFDMGKAIGQDLRRVGVHINFAPVVDINNNPANPVINFRSFGENRYAVTARSYQYLQGLEAAGVMACLKHFPGHGDTETDSHKGLPAILHSRQRLDSLELFPFRTLSQVAPSMMIAHLEVPALEPEAGRPTTLSRPVVTTLLREDWGYAGLIFTDAMDMGGVAGSWPPGKAEAEALRAGNDMILLPPDLPRAMDTLLRQLRTGALPRDLIAEKVRRVLLAKYRMGLDRFSPIPLAGLREDLHRPGAKKLRQQLFTSAMTLVRDSAGLLPIQVGRYKNPLLLRLGASGSETFARKWQDLSPGFDQLSVPTRISTGALLRRIESLGPDLLVVALGGLKRYPGNRYGLRQAEIELLRALEKKYPVALVLLGNPYAAAYLDFVPTLLCAYQEDAAAQEAAVRALLGLEPISGKLPVTVGSTMEAGAGIYLPAARIKIP